MSDNIDATISQKPADWCDPSDYAILRIVKANSADPDELRKLEVQVQSKADNTTSEMVITKRNFTGFVDSGKHWEKFCRDVQTSITVENGDDGAVQEILPKEKTLWEKIRGWLIWIVLGILVVVFVVVALIILIVYNKLTN